MDIGGAHRGAAAFCKSSQTVVLAGLLEEIRHGWNTRHGEVITLIRLATDARRG
ncbi:MULTISPECIES: hypothetical protein [unclassified Pseudomonas]|uniref:hypothetical protein n=1 Tax=unclassified Pseudomonas TaxID=196821 RepID=UPI0023B99E7B|nr:MULTISPECIES: hypothetical protein [unclassified Pseudomonas]